jgi:hypothetical protein
MSAIGRSLGPMPSFGGKADIPSGPLLTDCVEKLGVDADRDR